MDARRRASRLGSASRDAAQALLRVPSMTEHQLGRRNLLQTVGTAAAASAVAACRRPIKKLVPYSRQVEYSVPGVAYHFASARVERGEVIGLVAEVHENRPTKLEGNPYHPSNAGTTDLRTQASILDLYDPDRPGRVSRKDGSGRVEVSADELDRFLDGVLERGQRDQGARLRLLMEPSVSPTFLRLCAAFKTRFPQARIHTGRRSTRQRPGWVSPRVRSVTERRLRPLERPHGPLAGQ